MKQNICVLGLPAFRELFNRMFGFLVDLGIGPAKIYVLQDRGRKSGKVDSSPLDRLKSGGELYFVAAVFPNCGGSSQKAFSEVASSHPAFKLLESRNSHSA